MDWNGQVAVITGAASGIGAGIARHAAAMGMKVIACDVDTDGLATLLADTAKYSGQISTHILDVSDAAAVEALAADCFEQHRQVNLLFNNAGVLVDGKSWERSLNDWRWSLDVNIMGVIHGIRSFVPRMLQQTKAGRVINTSSIGGLLGGGAFMAPYQGTKHAITVITESLHAELEMEAAPISASVLCPGEVDTGIWQSDRLRDDTEKNVLASESEQQFHQAVAQQVAAGLTPDEFARRVFDEIEKDQFWLLPQEEFRPLFQQRVKSILEKSNPLSMAEMMAAIKQPG